MTTFAEAVEALADAKIIAVIIGDYAKGGYSKDELSYEEEEGLVPTIDLEKRGVPLSWEEAKPLLNYPYESALGRARCHAVYVYTEACVIFVTEYDGVTELEKILRFPYACWPVLL